MPYNLENILSHVREVEEKQKNTETERSSKTDPRLLNLKIGNSYTIRLIPNIKDKDNPVRVTYNEIGFTSRTTNKYIPCGRSPKDLGINDDIFHKTQWKAYEAAVAANDEVARRAAIKLLPQRKQLMNGYLVAVDGDDEEAKEKIGSVVVIRYAAQINHKDKTVISDIAKRIENALFGDMAKKIGVRAIDLGPNGKSLVIKVTKKGDWANYSDTMFDDAEDLKLSKERIEEILASAHNLNDFVPKLKTQEELKKIIDEHWYGTSSNPDDDMDTDAAPAKRTSTKNSKIDLSDDSENDSIPMDDDTSLDDLMSDD